MKRAVLLLTAALTASVAVTAHAAPSPKATGGVIYDNGVGQGLHLDFNAQGSADSAKGHIHFFNPYTGVQFDADVNCYTQVGNQGTMSGIVTNGDKTGIYVRVVAIDNGEPGSGHDFVRVTRRAPPAPPFRCASARPVPERNVVDGNIQIHGDPPTLAQQALVAATSDELPGDEDL